MSTSLANTTIDRQPLATWQVQRWKDDADALALIKAQQALNYVVDVQLKSKGRVLFYVKNDQIARAVVESFEAKDPEIDFITADGSWVRFPRKSVASVSYMTREKYSLL